VLLLDEPTSNLDMLHQLEVMETVICLVKEKKISAVMAIHDLNLASRFSDKLVMLKKGKIYAAGVPKELLNECNIRVGLRNKLHDFKCLGQAVHSPYRIGQRYDCMRLASLTWLAMRLIPGCPSLA